MEETDKPRLRALLAEDNYFGKPHVVAESTFALTPEFGWHVMFFRFGVYQSEELFHGSLADLTVQYGTDAVKEGADYGGDMLEQGAEMFFTLLAGNGDGYEVTPAKNPFVPRAREAVLAEMGFKS